MPTMPEIPVNTTHPTIANSQLNDPLTLPPKPYQITAVPAFKNNYIWILHNDHDAYIVDPGDAKPVLAFLHQQNLRPQAILITHRHADHIGGIDEILQHYTIPVIGPEGIHHITRVVNEGDKIMLAEFQRELQVLSIPGHTQEHIAFWCEQDHQLFSGDTLFSAGCGRVLGGTIEQLFNSIQRIASLPDDTLIYAAHEYTHTNLRFALSIEPGNPLLLEALTHSLKLPTLPMRLGKERQINPFLRCNDPSLQQAVIANSRKNTCEPLEIFVYLRQQKDHF